MTEPTEPNDPTTAALETSGGLQQTTDDGDLAAQLVREAATQIDRFLVIASLGKGGMGEVFLAYDPKLRRKIALKLLHRRGGEQSTQALIREAQRLARLSHPNVVQIYEIGEHDAAAFVAMEYVEGATLRAWLAADGRRRDWQAITRALIQAGRGLAAAHDAGLVHRDVKPDNIMIGDDARARVLDFGLARAVAGGSASAELGVEPDPRAIAGTPAYLAPECVVGRPGDALSDQFGFCVTAFECLFGQRPFVGATMPELFTNIVNGRVREPDPLPELPARVRQAIDRGLAIEARARWSSMHALVAELEDVISQIELRERIARLREAGALSWLDAGPERVELRAQPKLYGRAHERDTLLAAFARIQAGGPARAVELVALHGVAGVGKSALIDELCASVPSDAIVLRGKFEQLERARPLTGFVEALTGLAEQLTGFAERRRARLREQILAAIGRNLRMLTTLVPALAAELGPGASDDDDPHGDRLNRLKLLVTRLLAAVAEPGAPVVLVLDDLQWIDPTSLTLLEHLVGSDESRSLLVVGGYRSREVDEQHPLTAALARLRARRPTTEIELAALDRAVVTELLADMLGAAPAATEALAGVLVDKTGGNPLFLLQFIRALREEGLLRERDGSWSWSLGQLAARPITDNVAELLLDQLDALPEASQRLIQLAACLGNHFDLATLARASGRSPLATSAALWPTLEQGLLLTDIGKLSQLGELDSGAPLELAADSAAGIRLRFAHDRVQAAAYSTLDGEARAASHLEIARRLREATDDRLGFEVVEQFNAGRELIDDPAERRELAERNLACATRALASAAPAAAVAYLEVARELVEADERELAFAIHSKLARARSLVGDDDGARSLRAELLGWALDDRQQIEVQRGAFEHALLISNYDAAFAACREALRRYGLEVPADEADAGQRLGPEFAELEAALATVDLAGLRAAAPLDDRQQLELVDLLYRFGVLCYRSSRPLLMTWAVARLTRLSLAGRSAVAGVAYVCFGFILATQANYAGAQAFGAIGWALTVDYDDPVLVARSAVVHYGLIGHVDRPRRELAEALYRAYPPCVEAGEFVDASDLLLLGDSLLLASGAPLTEVMAAIEAHLPWFRSAAPVPLAAFYEPYLVALTCALVDRDPATLGVDFDADAFLARHADVAIAKAWYFSALTKLEVLDGVAQPPELLRERVATVELGVIGQWHVPETRCCAALSMLRWARAQPGGVDPDTRAAIEDSVAGWQRQLDVLRGRCPSNFAARYLLVEAELARWRDAPLDETIELYEQAIEAAHGDPPQAALGARLYAEFWLARGSRRTAALHLRDAVARLHEWGATRLVRALEREHPELLA